MSNKSFLMSDALYQYLSDVSIRESDVLARLRQETATSVDYPEMQIAPEQGQFMYLLLKLMGAGRALEIGTYTGYSSICIASALGPHGHLTCCDINKDWTDIAQRYWAETGLAGNIDLRLGPALETLNDLLMEGQDDRYDFIFIDADKTSYPAYYELALQLVRQGGLIAVDNVLWGGEVANPDARGDSLRGIRALNELISRDNRVEVSLVPIADGLMLARKVLEA